ncbi:MAG: RtcB family protein [Chloroflexi bacterium]|nr:RtcB family protein [Chloroflexota bacterium]
MVNKRDFRKINNYLWELPVTYRETMRVPARLYADNDLLEDCLKDRSVEQLVNTATLPGLVGYTLAMPDIHQGYGFPVGGVAATDARTGVISPGGIGYDINCGVRLLATSLDREEVTPHLSLLASALYRNCPSGVGTAGHVNLTNAQLDEVLERGALWALKHGMAREEDLEFTEENGTMPGARADKVSAHAKDRGRDQLGTLGAGNHFIEVDEVSEVFDAEGADALGLCLGLVVVQIHCGSRGFGHQVCTDYVRDFQSAIKRFGIVLPDRELVCAPLDSPEGRDYLAAMTAAANFAWCNRQILTHEVRQAFEQSLAGKVRDWGVRQVYDIAHNIAKVEEHHPDGGAAVRVCMHRKGATRAFGPGSPVLPGDYRKVGQPVFVPGSMGTSSWVLLGTAGSMTQSFGSTCHGAGRVLSRTAAKKQVRGEDLRSQMERDGMVVRAGSMSGLAEEAPMAYKDVDRVVNVVCGAGIARKVARLKPMAVIKG